jgi:hypothetical protein
LSEPLSTSINTCEWRAESDVPTNSSGTGVWCSRKRKILLTPIKL